MRRVTDPSIVDGHSGFDLFAYERVAMAGKGDCPFVPTSSLDRPKSLHKYELHQSAV